MDLALALYSEVVVQGSTEARRRGKVAMGPQALSLSSSGMTGPHEVPQNIVSAQEKYVVHALPQLLLRKSHSTMDNTVQLEVN